MSQPNEDAIREQAYYLWEKDGRPMGRDVEYWQRAVILAAPKAHIDALVKPAPKAKAKAPEPKAAVQVKSAATTSQSAPAKSVKADSKKPKKK